MPRSKSRLAQVLSSLHADQQPSPWACCGSWWPHQRNLGRQSGDFGAPLRAAGIRAGTARRCWSGLVWSGLGVDGQGPSLLAWVSEGEGHPPYLTFSALRDSGQTSADRLIQYTGYCVARQHGLEWLEGTSTVQSSQCRMPTSLMPVCRALSITRRACA